MPLHALRTVRPTARLVLVALVVLATALTAALTTAPAGAFAPAADPDPSVLVLDAPATGTVHQPGTLHAVLSGRSGPVVGAAVRFEVRSGSTWTPVATVATDADGAASYALTLDATSTTVRATYDGDADHAPATSEEHTVTAPALASSLVVSGYHHVVDEHTLTLRLTWKGADGTPIAGPVVLQQHVRGGSWHRVAGYSTAASGSVLVTQTPRHDTWYRATGGAGRWWRAAASASFSVDNRPPVPPVRLRAGSPKASYVAAQGRGSGSGAHVVVTTIPDAVWDQMTGITWHSGCPVGRSGLRLITVNYWGFDGYRRRGQLVVNKGATTHFKGALEDLYAAHVPIRRMYRVDRFGYSQRSHGGDDYSSMRHDNTSAFNCRWVTGRSGVVSPHAYGYAFDLDTWENPYHSRQGWLPDSWWAHRSQARVTWRSRSARVVRIMVGNGFSWTYGTADSQHFDAHRGGSGTTALVGGALVGTGCLEVCD